MLEASNCLTRVCVGVLPDQDMTQEQLEEMMQQAGKSNADGGKELQISLEQKEGGSSGEKQQQQCAPFLPLCRPCLVTLITFEFLAGVTCHERGCSL